MDEYFIWSMVGGLCAIIFVILSYMGFFTKVVCSEEEIDELILAYDNFEAPYLNMDLEGSEFRKKIEIACGKSIVSKQVAIYYDDPRFAANIGRWGIAYEVSEDSLDLLALNNISFVRIPAGRCLSVVFPYRNFLSYGLGARKAFDTMVSTAEKNNIIISAPPMEIYTANSHTIRYILYLDNIHIIHSMCESPFTIEFSSS